MQTLAKTVSIYQRSQAKADLSKVEGMTVSKLREEVCSAVETEIHNQVTEFEITDDEHIEISHAAWARFYSCAIQVLPTDPILFSLLFCFCDMSYLEGRSMTTTYM